MFYYTSVESGRKEFSDALSLRSEGTEGSESLRKEHLLVLADDVKEEWRLLWRDRIDDKVRAEGMASSDYSLLFVERGTVIIATRDFKPLDLRDILRLHEVEDIDRIVAPHPSVGGWGKFARTVLNKQRRARRWEILPPTRRCRKALQLKKSGRGWLHYHIKK